MSYHRFLGALYLAITTSIAALMILLDELLSNGAFRLNLFTAAGVMLVIMASIPAAIAVRDWRDLNTKEGGP